MLDGGQTELVEDKSPTELFLRTVVAPLVARILSLLGLSAVSCDCPIGHLAAAVTCGRLALSGVLGLMGNAQDDASGGLGGNRQCPICP